MPNIPRPKRWLQFSIRTLLLTVFILTAVSAVLGNRFRTRTEVLNLHHAGGYVYLLDSLDSLTETRYEGCNCTPFHVLDGAAMYHNLDMRPLPLDWHPQRGKLIYVNVFCADWAGGRSALPRLSRPELLSIEKAISLREPNDDDLRYVSELPSVRLLSIYSDEVTDEGVTRCLQGKAAADIEFLSVVGSQLTGRVAASILKLKKLRVLEFRPGSLANLPPDWDQQVAKPNFEFLKVKEKQDPDLDAISDVIFCH